MTAGAPAKRLTPVEWATISALYERGEKNTRELAEQFGVSRQAIEGGLRQRNVTRAARIDEVRGEVEDLAREEHRKRVAEATKLKTDYAGYLSFIAKLTMKKVADANTASNIAGINADLIALGNATKIIAKVQERTWDILDIKDIEDGEAELPDLHVGEYSPDEIDGIRAANEQTYVDNQADDDDADTAE